MAVSSAVQAMIGAGFNMNNLSLLSLALLVVAPPMALAHKVPYIDAKCALDEDQAEYEEIPLCSEEEKEKSAATAFCRFIGHTAFESCVEGIASQGMAEAAGKCVEESLEKQIRPEDALLAHKVGGTGGAEGAHWHTNYKYSKDDGLHRHDWSEAARDQAGRQYGMALVRDVKEKSVVNKTTNETSTNWNIGGVFKSIFGVSRVAELDIEANANQGGGKNSSIEKGPASQAELDKAYKEGYDIAYADPNRTNVSPNITCESGKPKCSTSFSRDYVNEDYKPQGGAKTDDGNPSSSSSDKASGDKRGGNKNSPPPPSKSKDEMGVKIKDSAPQKYAGDPATVTKPGEMLATWDETMTDSSLARCLLEKVVEQMSQDKDKTYSPDGAELTWEEQEKKAQDLLKKGICDEKFYGPAFCQKHKTFELTGNYMQDPPKEKTIDFEALQDLSTINYGNPADHKNTRPIDFNGSSRPTRPARPSHLPVVPFAPK
jgi:hypothetical protein